MNNNINIYCVTDKPLLKLENSHLNLAGVGKNLLKNDDDKWIGFCQKRRFWIKESSKDFKISKDNLTEHLLTEIPQNFTKYESFLCEPIFVNNVKKIKMLKKGYKSLMRNPSIFLIQIFNH